MFRCIVFTIVFGIISACSEQNDLKNSKVGSSQSDVDSSGGDSGGSGSTSGAFVISAITGSTTEAGGTATFTVNLKSQPSANVSIAISSSDTTEGTVSPSSIMFSSSNWSTAQTVTVTGADDTAVDGNQGYTIILGVASSSDSNYSGLDPADVSVSNTDDDAAGITINSPGDNTTESGGSFTFTAKLNSQPSSDVTIAISSSDSSEGAIDSSSLTFTSSNWGTEQSVLIYGVDDYLDDGNQNYTVTIGAASSSDSNYYGTDPDDLSVTNIDDDTAGFTVTTISGVTTEYGTTATFTVKLSSQPTANVTIAVSSSNTAEGTVSPSTLTFTSSNWSTAQTVTATGVNDGSADGNQNYNIVLGAATSSDSNFSSINPADVAVTNTDDDTAGFTITSITDNTTELGDNATFTLILNSQPSANVTIGVSSSDTGEGTVSPSSLTFTNSNWSTAQTVTVTGADDNISDRNQSYSVVIAASSSSDGNYNGINPDDFTIKNIDDEYVLPDTGQTEDYISTFGEDSDYTINPPALVDNGDGTISDNNTKLMWQQQDTNNIHTYSNAISHCNDLSHAEYSDWRLPSKKELISIVDFGRINPAIDVSKFPNIKSSTYWTSTVSNYSGSYAWTVTFSQGKFVPAAQSRFGFWALCVRNNQKTISFVDNGDNTITDQKTRLIWQKQDDGSKRSRENALDYCENLTLGGSSAWRLPNIKELESIVDDNRVSPSINTSYFTNTKSGSNSDYISSSEYLASSNYSWTVTFNSGEASIAGHTSSSYVRCVRGGQ